MGSDPLTPEQSREDDRGHAMSIPAERVGGWLEIMADWLNMFRNETEVLKDRPDLDDEEREVARRIFVGLETWSELIFDGTEDEGQ